MFLLYRFCPTVRVGIMHDGKCRKSAFISFDLRFIKRNEWEMAVFKCSESNQINSWIAYDIPVQLDTYQSSTSHLHND